MSLQRLVRIGRAGRPHGVRGALSVHLDDPSSTALCSAPSVVLDLDGARTERAVARAIPGTAGRWILELEGLAGRAEAAALTNAVVLVDRSCLGLAEGEILVSDLPGREIAEGGRTAGRIVSSFHNGAHDVLVVETLRGRVDFPLVEERVLGLDSSGRLEVEGFSDFQDLAYEPGETDP